MSEMHARGILLLYNLPLLVPAASTITDSLSAFRRYSGFSVWEVNTALGFPKNLAKLHFDVIVLHYSLFGYGYKYELNDRFCEYLSGCDSSYKIAFFQDEYRYCSKRFRFVNDFGVHMVYTCIEPKHHDEVYRKYTAAEKVECYLPGYVSEEMVFAGSVYRSNRDRAVDIGYRARRLEYYMGRGAQEKHQIGLDFIRMANEKNLSLNLDIDVEEENRLYGNAWHRFLGSCKAMLGVESGVSIVDIHDEVRVACERLLEENPEISFEEIYDRILHRWENNIPLRTISPRHFESASFGTCQILYEGRYSDVMTPFLHYIPLKKDYSNFDDVIRMFRDESLCREVTLNAYRSLIESGFYSYKRFIRGFDRQLNETGLVSEKMEEGEIRKMTDFLNEGYTLRSIRGSLRDYLQYAPFPGRKPISNVVRALRAIYQSKFMNKTG